MLAKLKIIFTDLSLFIIKTLIFLLIYLNLDIIEPELLRVAVRALNMFVIVEAVLVNFMNFIFDVITSVTNEKRFSFLQKLKSYLIEEIICLILGLVSLGIFINGTTEAYKEELTIKTGAIFILLVIVLILICLFSIYMLKSLINDFKDIKKMKTNLVKVELIKKCKYYKYSLFYCVAKFYKEEEMIFLPYRTYLKKRKDIKAGEIIEMEVFQFNNSERLYLINVNLIENKGKQL